MSLFEKKLRGEDVRTHLALSCVTVVQQHINPGTTEEIKHIIHRKPLKYHLENDCLEDYPEKLEANYQVFLSYEKIITNADVCL